MFLSVLQTYVVVILIAVIVLQYAFALFCLLKLAYFDLTKRDYVLWNLFILIVFFIGGIAFLVYYYTHPDKHITPASYEVKPDNEQEQTETEQTGGEPEQQVEQEPTEGNE